MRRAFGIISFVIVSVLASAQTQQGEVKTRGRMENGVLKPGKGLAGATVYVTGRQAVRSEGDAGRFSFPVTGQKFRIEKVQKQGYQLIDYSVCTEYRFSANPLRLVMETPEQQQSDQLAAERKIRRNLQRQLQQKEDEIEALQVSQQEKDSLLRILYQQQTDNEKLIADMAKRYSTLDYDQLDEFYRQVSWFIENGELTRADSLLRTRGDINAQVQGILKQGEAIQAQKEQLQKAESVHQADIEEAARRCYSYYETFSAQHERDSAAYYLELRASLDTTNVEWSSKAGQYIKDYLADYPKAMEYFLRMLRHALKQFGEENDWTAAAYSNIGNVYIFMGEYAKALEYHTKALTIDEKVLGNEHPDIAISYNNIGSAYSQKGDYHNALEYHIKALAIREKILGNEHPDVATSYNNIGSVFYSLGDYHKSLECHTKALTISEKVLGSEHLNVATFYSNIGSDYSKLGNYARALECYIKAKTIREKVLGPEHPDTKLTNKIVLYTRYLLALSTKRLPEFLLTHIFTTTIKDGDTPAKDKGMSGEYVLLEFADWTQDSPTSLYDKNEEHQGKPKTIVVMKDGVISCHYFENAMGALLGIKEVDSAEKQRINEAYEKWKKQQLK